MRLPIAVSLESRDGTLTRDAKVKNAIVEVSADKATVRKRPGMTDLGSIKSGTSQMLADFYGLRVVIGDTVLSGTLGTIISSPTSTTIAPSVANLPMQWATTAEGAATPRMMFKNRTNAYTMVRAGTVSTVTYGATMGSYTWNLASLTGTSSTATATVAGSLELSAGQSVVIAGATPTDYNGTFTVSSVTAGSYTPARDIPITIVRSGTTATATTVSGNHGLSSTTYTIAGANESAYNGAKAITVTGATTFTYTVTETAAATEKWNSADKSSYVTLTGSDLIASGNNASSGGCVRATTSRASRKWYWEVTITAVPTTHGIAVGIADATHNLANIPGDSDSHGCSIWINSSYPGQTRVSYGASTISIGANFVAGDVIGVALDCDGGGVTFYRNGTLVTPVTIAVGTWFPCVLPAFTTGASVTVNFGASAFAYSAPSGFIAYQTTTPYSPASGTIIVTDPAVTVNAQFTYSTTTTTSPATGTITATVTGGTVPGIVYLNGYFCVMDLNGTIYNSALDDPTSWTSTNYITAQNEPGAGVALAKSGNYLVALKEWSSEFFYDAKNPTGSPFSPVDNGFTLIGCASGLSVAKSESAIVFVAQSRQHSGRMVYLMSGLDQQKISSPDVERVLDQDTLSSVWAFCIKLDGHRLYILTLNNSGVTLVYDFETKIWHEWTALTIGSSKSVSSITRSGTTATVTTATAHGVSDGDPVKISGANQTEYNGIFQASYVSSTIYTIQVADTAATPATGTILSYPYTSGKFPYIAHVNFDGNDLLLDESSGHLYRVDSDYAQDSGVPIDFFVRTKVIDGGTLEIKRLPFIRVVGEKLDDIGMIRWTDDESATFSAYRVVDLSEGQRDVRRCGSFRRRSIEFRHVGNSSPRITELELGGWK